MPGGESIPDKENLRWEILGILWNSKKAMEEVRRNIETEVRALREWGRSCRGL